MSDDGLRVGTERRHYRCKVWQTDKVSADEAGSYPVTEASEIPLRLMVSTQETSLYLSKEPVLKKDVRTAVSSSIKSQEHRASLAEWLGRQLTKIWVPETEQPAIIDTTLQVVESAVSALPIYVDVRVISCYEKLYVAAAGTGKKIVVPARGDVCSICYKNVKKMEQGDSCFPCDHRFHPRCILWWVDNNAGCPNCQALANKDEDLSADEDPEPDEHPASEVEVAEPHH